MHIALLRGINVGVRNLIAMADLRAMADGLGLGPSKTLLQSGNLLFEGAKRSASTLEKTLEAETQKQFGTAVDYMVRTAAEWNALIADNPFPDEAETDPSHLVALILKGDATPAKVKALQAAIRGPEVVRGSGRRLYITYPNGIGDSKLTNAMIEKTLGLRGTARNWNTVLKVATGLRA